MLAATTIYLTPYRSREQIVSGALTFAIVAGCPTVSTPYFYAEDLLASGAGVLVPFDDPAALADAVTGLLDDPERLARGARRGARGRRASWPGRRSAGRPRTCCARRWRSARRTVARHPPPATLPRARASHLLTMVDDVGIVQHADGIVPLRASGYCTDDIARLAIVAARHGPDHRRRGLPPDAGAQPELPAPRLGRRARRDAQLHVLRPALAGRAARRRPPRSRGLGARRGGRGRAGPRAARAQPDPAARDAAGARRPALAPDDGLRGARARPRRSRRGRRRRRRGPARASAARLADQQRANASPDWYWAEDALTYDNARLPQALIAAGDRLGDAEMLGEGLRALDWYAGELGHRRPVAAARRPPRPAPRRAAGRAAATSSRSTPPRSWRPRSRRSSSPATSARARRAVRAFEWFLGRNRLQRSVYDFSTGGCHDGLGESDVNGNEGAESTLAYLQALLALDAAGLQTTLPE